MFPQSSQKRYWVFSDENDLTVLREKTNAEFIERHGTNMTVSDATFHVESLFLFYIPIFERMFHRTSCT